MDNLTSQKLVNAEDCVQELFGDTISTRTFLEWKARGFIPFIKVGRRIFYDVEQVRETIKANFTIGGSK